MIVCTTKCAERSGMENAEPARLRVKLGKNTFAIRRSGTWIVEKLGA
jgi:hypothetical protein